MSLLHIAGGISTTPPGQQAYTAPGTYLWVCPPDITKVCVVCVGTAAGNSAGALAWKNNITVVPGTSYTVFIPSYPNDSNQFSYFISSAIVGAGTLSSRVGDGGGDGGNGMGAGAGGYTGNGGVCLLVGNGTAGTGGAGGGGGGNQDDWGLIGGGGGVGILGQGANGVGGIRGDASYTGGGGGGSSGGAGGTSIKYGAGGYGGSFGGCRGSAGGVYGTGGNGAVRIIWGANRAFPSTNTGNM